MVYQDYSSSFDDLLIKDGSVCIHHRNIQLVAIEMFKVKYNLSPEIEKYIFEFNTDPRVEKTFVIPYANNEYLGKLSLRWFGPVVWEIMLPESYKKITVVENFKNDIKKWIPENCQCRLCKEYVRGLGFITLFE